MDFAVPADHVKENEKRIEYLDLAREMKNLRDIKVTVIPIVIGALDTVTRGFGTGIGGLGNKRTSGDHSNFSIIEIGQNTKKSPGDLRRLAVTLTPVENHQLKLV